MNVERALLGLAHSVAEQVNEKMVPVKEGGMCAHAIVTMISVPFKESIELHQDFDSLTGMTLVSSDNVLWWLEVNRMCFL
jgi:hypothetical protein